jgi:hypothetical protein
VFLDVLRQIDDFPKNYRYSLLVTFLLLAGGRAFSRFCVSFFVFLSARIYNVLLLGLKTKANLPFLTQQLNLRFEDLRRACLVLEPELFSKKKRKNHEVRAAELMAIYQIQLRLQGKQDSLVESITGQDLCSFIQVLIFLFSFFPFAIC